MSRKKKVAAVLITTVALSVGTVGIASADSQSKNRGNSAHGAKGVRGDMTAFLAQLVAKGTITQTQADAIIAAAKSAADAPRPSEPGHAAQLALIASTIGIDSATIQSRLKAGESLATIAGAKKDALIAALIADYTKRIDADVVAGKITAAQATTLKANLKDHVTKHVEETGAHGGKGGKFGNKGGHRDGDKTRSTSTTSAAA